jgi:hypothetical protein
MMLKIFSVYDSKSATFARPFFDVSLGSALRSFADIAKDKSHPIGVHPEDYSLFQLGEWNDANAVFTSLPAPVSLGLALELVASSNPPTVVANG